jgi:flagellar hook-basal body complex protein FliE
MSPVGPVTTVAAPGVSPAVGLQAVGRGFDSALGGALGSLAQTESTAQTLALEMATGQGVPLGTALTAVSEASLASEATVTVISKALEAYQTIMNMQV